MWWGYRDSITDLPTLTSYLWASQGCLISLPPDKTKDLENEQRPRRKCSTAWVRRVSNRQITHLTLHNSFRCMGFTLGDKRSLPAVYNSFATQIYIAVLKKIKRAPRVLTRSPVEVTCIKILTWRKMKRNYRHDGKRILLSIHDIHTLHVIYTHI